MVEAPGSSDSNTSVLIDEGVAAAYRAAVYRLGAEENTDAEVNRVAAMISAVTNGEQADVAALALHFILCQILEASVEKGRVQ